MPKLTYLQPIVKVIAHTEFHGVPVELLPMEEARVALVKAHGPDQADGNVESLARQIIDAKGQDQGVTAERLIECAGRTCYDSYGIGRKSTAYHQHIMDVDHGSVCEHAWLTWFLGNISRGLTHELVRHRVGVAISQRSTRYVDEDGSWWVLHPLIEQYIFDNEAREEADVRPTTENLIFDVIRTAGDAYAVIADRLERFAVDRGIDKFTARKQARGAARGLLGNSLLTEMVWSCNARTMRSTILKQRGNGAADAEIRRLGLKLYETAKPYWPNYLGDFQTRPSPDKLADELYQPNSTVERLKVAEASNKNLLARIAELEAKMTEPGAGDKNNGG